MSVQSSIDVAIVGGGISGLHTAFELAKRGVSFRLFEARERFGGRIYSPSASQQIVNCDIGPSWFWPGQNRIESLVIELGLQDLMFEQYSQGDSLYEPETGSLLRGVPGISMQGSYRLLGGLAVLADALRERIEDMVSAEPLQCGAIVNSIDMTDGALELQLKSGQRVQARHIVLALPPRVALRQIQFQPALKQNRIQELQRVATWMAGHAKAVVLYEQPFWREAGFSGDVISQVGPLSEIHDASTPEGDVAALFGFFMTPPNMRADNKPEIERHIIAQLVRVFGERAARASEILYKDWARDAFTATDLDQTIPNHHPSNEWRNKSEGAFDHRLLWSGTESAAGHFNGFIEGALIASEHVLQLLDSCDLGYK